MSYIVEYTSLSGKRIPMMHKVFESADAANAYAAENVANGNYKSYTVNELNEGYKIMPPMDPKYVARKGLEGPFTTLSGKVVYYDPKEGSYYDPDTDMYMSYDEFQKYDNNYSDMKDERDIPVKEALTLDYSRYMRSHGKKPRYAGPGLFMFTTKDMGEPDEDDIFQFQGSWADAKRAAAKWAKSKDASRFYIMENNDDRNELTKKLFPKKSREEMEKADRERNRAMNAKRFMKPGKPSRSREWGAYESVEEAVAKIACTKCDEVSTAAAWKKKGGFCPKCKTSNQGVAESINEGISDDAHHMERDHEVQMARSDLYKTANYAIKLHAILKGISEEQGLDGWMQSKITKAADYMSSVFHALEYDELERSQSEPMPAMESEDKEKIQKQIDQTEKHMKSFSGNTSSVKMKKVAMQKKIAGLKAKLKELSEGKTASQNRNALVSKIKKSGVVKSGSMSKDDKKVDETTTAGGIATAPMPMGKVIKRKKK